MMNINKFSYLKQLKLYSKNNNRSFATYSPKTKEDILAKIHKHNINTVTMGFPDLYGKFFGKKYDSEYFAEVKYHNLIHRKH
jgi:hypothetical protein